MLYYITTVLADRNRWSGGSNIHEIRIIWDLEDDPDGNVAHVAEHGFTQEDVEDVLLSPDSETDTSRSSGANITFGYTSTGRFVAVVWELIIDDPLTMRPITAYEVPEPIGNSAAKSNVQRHRLKSTGTVSQSQKDRDRAIRAKFASKPSRSELQATGEYNPSVKHGAYIALMHFAASLKRFRELQHLSLTDLADRSGIDKSAISRLENGQVDNPTIQTLERLARSLGKRIRIELEDESPRAGR